MGYIEKPLTLDNLKFDLRLYLVITEIVPNLKGLLYREGLARFCLSKYKGSKYKDKNNESSHLTNYSINKKNTSFKDNSSKRLLSTTLIEISKKYRKFSISKF